MVRMPSPAGYQHITNFCTGRRIATTPTRSWTRSLATEVDIESIESSLDNSLRETKSIEQEVQYRTEELVPQIDDQTHSTHILPDYGTPKEYEKYRKHRTLSPLHDLEYYILICNYYRTIQKTAWHKHSRALPTTSPPHLTPSPLRYYP